MQKIVKKVTDHLQGSVSHGDSLHGSDSLGNLIAGLAPNVKGLVHNKGNGNHHGHDDDHGHNGNHGNDNNYGVEYANDKANINMANYIEGAVKNGATVIYGTQEVDYLNISTDNTIVYGLEEADIISSTASNNILNGGAGNDVIFSAEYDTVINGGNDDDAIFGNNGSDVLNGDEGDDQIYGGSGNDVINGGKGNDILHNIGNGETSTTPGNDILTGGKGNDVFAFYGYTLGSNNIAKITDFKSGVDKLVVVYFDSITGSVDFSDSFVQGNNAYAHDANDFFIFDTHSSALYYDADGSGVVKAVQLATLTGVHSLTAGDFQNTF